MKIYMITDMEGVCGVLDHDNWVLPTGRYYEEGKELLTLEANAAIEGFFSAGAEEILVVDGHGAGGIHHKLLDSRILYQRGSSGPYPFGLDATFDVMAWVGQHAKAGTEYAHIAHTGWFNVLDYKINGVSVGEFGQMAFLGSAYGVKSIFGSGDEAFTKEAQSLIPGIETVSVKKGLTPGKGDEYDTEGYRNRNLAAVHLHPQLARELIQKGAAQALKRYIENSETFHLPVLQAPFRREVKYRPDKGTPSYCAHAQHPTDLVSMMNSKETEVTP
jgi:D-amino peptidase